MVQRRFPFFGRSQPNTEDWRERQGGGSFLMWAGRLLPIKSWGSTDILAGHSPAEYRPEDGHRTAAMRESIIVYRCVALIQNTVNSIPYFAEVNGDRVDQHPLLNAINQNYRFNKSQLFGQWARSLQLYGEVYIEKIPSAAYNGVSGLRRLNNNAIEPDVIQGRIIRYSYSPQNGGGMIPFETYEILFDKYENDGDDLRGLAPLDVALSAVNIDRDQQESIKSFLRNNATPAGILTPKPGVTVTPEQRKSLMEQWQERFKGARNRGRVGFLTNAVEYQKIGEAITDAQIDLQDTTTKRICMAFGVPTALLGAWDTLDYQANPVMLGGFYNDTIDPLLTKIEDALKSDPDIQDTGAVLRFDRDALSAKIEDKSAVTTMNTQKFQTGGITLNEYREKTGEAKIEGGDFYIMPSGYTVVTQQQLESGGLPQPALPQPAAPAIVEPAPQTAIEQVDPTKDTDLPGLCVMLDLSNNPDLIALQRQVRSFVGLIPVEWNDPAKFHVTLAMAPVLDESKRAEVVAALESLEFPELKLNVGSLKAFDTVGKYALHFRVRNNTDLLDFQESVYDLLIEHGVALSSYSNPGTFTPHITMGYAGQKPPTATFKTRLVVTPLKAVIVDGDTVFGQIGGSEVAKTWILPDNGAPLAPMPNTAALDELKAWYKFHASGKSAKRDFVTSAIPDDVAYLLRHELGQGNDADVFKSWRRVLEARQGVTDFYDRYEAGRDAVPVAVKTLIDYLTELEVNSERVLISARDLYTGIVAAKAITNTRARFETELERQMLRAFNEKVKKPAFIRNMLIMLNRYARLAYIDGYADADIELNLDDTEDEEAIDGTAWLSGFVDDQEQYVRNIADVLYADDQITEDEIKANKPALWWNGSVYPAYAQALTKAGENIRLEWKLGNTEQHCESCPALRGIVLTAKRWKAEGIAPKSRLLSCGGWLCDCGFEVTKKKKYRGKLPVWRKSIDHIHTDECNHEPA